MPAAPALPTVAQQVDRLVALGLPAVAGCSESELRAYGDALGSARGALVAVHPSLVPVSSLTPMLRLNDKPGFVVEDMTDVDDFAAAPEVEVPDTPLYLVHAVDRGDEFRGVRPSDALPRIVESGRTPLTLGEGISWALQVPDVLVDNHCFMTIGSRLPRTRGTRTTYDARTPAIWISRGTGRDGAARRNAPKVGWCWWNNHHTWLGIASAASRSGGPAV